ncbi:MAG: hypothetical protein H7Z38_08905 [Rubrivivax sp.]|nr:hypothetical protein [Pyrinomonadaceae bacterium]
MRRNILAAVLALAASAGLSQAQTQSGARAGADHSTSVSRDGRQLDIASGTRLTAELQNTLDVSKARVGDKVLLKTTEAIKSNGETIAKRGSRLVGHVAQVSKRGKGSATSSITIIFDQLESGSLSTPISATINSITQVAGRARVGDDEASADASGRGSTSARSSGGSPSSSGGGLLGGVTSAVGNTVGGVAGAAGDVVGSTTDTVGGTVRGVGQIQITQSAGVSAEGGSTLSLTGGNLRLEKGTNFKLTLNESANVGNNQ